MKLKHLFIINAIIALAYALGELFIPQKLVSLYFVNDTPTAEVILTARYFGWGLLAVGLITAFVANAPPSETKQAIVKALFIAAVVGLIVSLMGIFSGTFTALGWSAIVIYAFIAAGFGYFWFIKPETA
ncbi:MAG: hypothetical protein ACYS91_18850 [Planctomycetota bacterium]|jgi:hypothetical protein